MDGLISVAVWFFSVVIVLILFPLSLLIWLVTFPFDRERAVMHWWLVFHGILFSRLIPLWELKVEGREKAKKNIAYVIISNHQSVLDILIMNCLRYRFRWISKIENNRVPVIGWYLKMAKYITIDRGNKESKAVMIGQAAESLRNGISIMIFPEGTRSHDREIGPFKLGAFQLALMTRTAILPVITDGTGGVLPKHGLVFSRGHKLRLKVMDPVEPGSFGTDNPEELAEKLRNLLVRELKNLRNEL